MRDLRAGKYAPVYVLMGDEAYYIDKISDFIAENALAPVLPSESFTHTAVSARLL